MKKSVKIISLLVTLVMVCTLCACNSCGGNPAPAEPRLTGIALDTSEVKKTFEVGETFTYEGLKVTAKYDAGEDKAVALSDCTVTPPDMTTAGNKPVTVTYSGAKAVYSVVVTEQHACESKCPVCGKCLDIACAEEVCEDKCAVGGETYTFEAEDSRVALLAGNFGKPKAMQQEQADREYVGNYDAKATVSFGVNVAKATTATLKITLSQGSFTVTDKLHVFVNGTRIERPTKMKERVTGTDKWYAFDEVNLGCISLDEGDNIIAFYNDGIGVNFDKITLTSPEAIVFSQSGTLTLDTSAVKKEFQKDGTFDFDGLKAALKIGDGEATEITMEDTELEVKTPDLTTPGKKTVEVVYKRFYSASYEIEVVISFDGKTVADFEGVKYGVKKTAGAGGDITIVNGHLDNINNNYGASFTFEVYSPAACTAQMWAKIGQRVFDLPFTNTYEITVNGNKYESETIVPKNPSGIDWSVFIQVYLGDVALVSGKNTVTFTVAAEELSKGNGLNFEKLTLATDDTELRWNEVLTVDASAVKKSYQLGEQLDASGLAVKYYNAANVTDLTAADYTLSEPDMLSAGVKTVTVSYNGYTATFEITVSDTAQRTEYEFTAFDGAELSGGARWNASNWVDGLNGAIGAGVTFEIYAANNGVATVTAIINTMNNGKRFSDSMSLTVNGTVYQSDATISYSQPSGWTATEVPVELCGVQLVQGKNTIVMKMVGNDGFWLKGIKLNSTVAAEWQYNTLAVNADGAKTTYNEGEAFSANGIVVTVRAGGQITALAADEYTVTAPDTGVAGTKTVTVTYRRLTATYDITVVGAPATKQEFAISTENVTLSDGLRIKTAASGKVYVDGLNDAEGRTVTMKIHSDVQKTATLYVTINLMQKGAVFTDRMGINVNTVDKTYDTVITFDGENKVWEDYWVTLKIGTVELQAGDNTFVFTSKVYGAMFWFGGITLETSANLSWAAA